MMATVLRDILRNFAVGTVTGMQADELPLEASPRSWNTSLMNVGGTHAVPSSRKGASVANQTAVTGSPIIHGQANYYRRSGAVLSQFHLLIDNAGNLNKLTGSTVAAADASAATPFTSGDYLPSVAYANNLCFMVNGVDKKKFDGTNVREFGITRPTTVGLTAVDSGVAGNPNGTYEFAIAYGNSSTGHESSRSDSVSVTVASKKITLNWATPSDGQVDQIFVYVRKTTLNAEFFRLTAGTSPAASAAGAFGTTADPITIDVTDTQLNALTTLAPDTAENDPPVAGVKALAVYQNRMFAIDSEKLYYSKSGKPEAFDPDFYEYFNKDDGQKPTGVFTAFGSLLLWKNNSMYQLSGIEPDTWQIDLIDPYIGCASQQSIVFVNGYVYWYSNKGPARWDGSGAIELIGERYIAPTISADTLNLSYLDHVCAAVDLFRQKVLFAVPETGQTRNTRILPFNYRTNGWDSDKWDPFDVASMCVVEDSSGTPWVMMGNYGGRVFKWWNAYLDGARVLNNASTPLTLSGTPTGTTSTTVTDSGATFDTDGAGLKELYLYVTDSAGSRERRRISSNTSTVITVSSAFNITPTSYVIATPDWQHDTRWGDFGDPFVHKRLLFIYAQALSMTGGGDITVELFRDWDLNNVVRTMTLTAVGAGSSMWDSATWDAATWGSDADMADWRSRVSKVCKTYRIRVRMQTPNVQVALAKLMVEASPQGRRR